MSEDKVAYKARDLKKYLDDHYEYDERKDIYNTIYSEVGKLRIDGFNEEFALKAILRELKREYNDKKLEAMVKDYVEEIQDVLAFMRSIFEFNHGYYMD